MSSSLSGLDAVVALLASVAATVIYFAQPDPWPYRWLCVGIVPLDVVARCVWLPVGVDAAVAAEARSAAPSGPRAVGGIALMIAGGVVAVLMGLLVAAMNTDSKGESLAWAAVPAAIGAAGLGAAMGGFRVARR